MRTKLTRDLDKLWSDNKMYVLQVLTDILAQEFKGKGEIFENISVGLFSKDNNPFNLALFAADGKTKICVYMDSRCKGRFTAVKITSNPTSYFFVNGIDGVNLYDRIVSDLK